MSTSSAVSCWIRSLSSWSEREPRSGKVSIGRAYQRIGHTQAEVEGGWRIAGEIGDLALHVASRELAARAAGVLDRRHDRHEEAEVDQARAERRPAHEAGEDRGHDRRDREAPPPVDPQLDAALERIAARGEHEELPAEQDGERPARQQLVVPADRAAADDEQAVDDGVEERA